jgi:raffinose/stachyose/melibiose transport system permease protein
MRRSYGLYLLPGAILTVAVIGVPFVMNIGISLTNWQGVGSPSWTGLSNYSKLFSDSQFWQSFEHNLVLLVAMAIIPVVIGLVLAYALFEVIGKRFNPRTAAVLRACIYLPQVLPIAVVGIVWSWILAPQNGALDQFLGKVGLHSLAQDWLGDPKLALLSVGGVMVWFQIGYPLVIFMSGMQRVDPALYEAADLDGARWYRKLWDITLPQIRAELYVVVLTCTIAALKVFPQIFVLTRGGPGGATNVPSYFSYQEFFEKTQVGYGASIATVLTVLILILTAVFVTVQNRTSR